MNRVGGIVEFSSFDMAENAKQSMHGYRFHGSNSGIGKHGLNL